MREDSRIAVNPAVMLGKPVIRGTRITVELILENLAQGGSIEDLLEGYPHISEEDIRAAVGYAAGMVHRQWRANWNGRGTIAEVGSSQHDGSTIRREDGAIINATELPAENLTHDKVLCPACRVFVFQKWPEGWDGHSGWKCTGLEGSDVEERKTEFKLRFALLFR
jgi:uncharacterized protein (DUF433 family)